MMNWLACVQERVIFSFTVNMIVYMTSKAKVSHHDLLRGKQIISIQPDLQNLTPLPLFRLFLSLSRRWCPATTTTHPSLIRTNSKWFLIVIYAIFGCPLLYMFWYRPLYRAMRFLFNLFEVLIIIEQHFMDMQILNLVLWCPHNWKCGNLRPVLHLITSITNRLQTFSLNNITHICT
jgi:hypothetical protein